VKTVSFQIIPKLQSDSENSEKQLYGLDHFVVVIKSGWRVVPSLIEGLQVVQGLRVLPVFLYRYSMKLSLKKARSPGTTEGGRSE
jgi:hypothetical protein